MFEKDRNAKPRVRVGMDMSPDSAKVLRSWAYTHFVHVRDVPVHMADKLSASEEARRLALGQAEVHRVRADDYARQVKHLTDAGETSLRLVKKWRVDCEALRDRPAWHDVAAAIGKRPVVAALIGAVAACCIGSTAALVCILMGG